MDGMDGVTMLQVNAMIQGQIRTNDDGVSKLAMLGCSVAGAATAGAIIGAINITASYMSTGSNSCQKKCNGQDKSMASPLANAPQGTCNAEPKSSCSPPMQAPAGAGSTTGGAFASTLLMSLPSALGS